MGERKSVTREDLAAATLAVEEEDERLGIVGRGRKVDRIFDALPATPPASETVDAARQRLMTDIAYAVDPERYMPGDYFESHRPFIDAFETAIRAESDETVDALLPTFEVGQVVGELQPGRRPHDWCSIHGDIGPMESIDGHAHKHHGSSAEDIRKARKVIKAARAPLDAAPEGAQLRATQRRLFVDWLVTQGLRPDMAAAALQRLELVDAL